MRDGEQGLAASAFNSAADGAASPGGRGAALFQQLGKGTSRPTEAVSSGKTEQQVDDDGRIYLAQPQHEGRFVTRSQVVQTSTAREDVLTAWTVIQELASELDI
jgi:hypothetical protein